MVPYLKDFATMVCIMLVTSNIHLLPMIQPLQGVAWVCVYHIKKIEWYYYVENQLDYAVTLHGVSAYFHFFQP